jgi:Disulphide bond corrector protein DsbC
MLSMSCIPTKGKAGSAARRRNPGVWGSPFLSAKGQVELKESGELGILQVEAWMDSYDMAEGRIRRRFQIQEAPMTNRFSIATRILQLAGVGLVIGTLAVAAPAGGQMESHVKLTATAGKVDKDGRQTISIKMQIDPDWHAYANPVKNDDLEPNQTVIKVTGPKNKKLDDVSITYPAGQRHMTGKETYQVYEGSVEFLATVKRTSGDTGPLELTVNYVTCNDKKGVCLPPETVKIDVK